MPMTAEPQLLNGTAIALAGRGLFISGRSGSGKSQLAIELISRGAMLIADDRVIATSRSGAAIWLSAPANITGLIEARGLGLLELPTVQAYLNAVVDLDTVEGERLPEVRETEIAGQVFPVFRKVESPSFAAMLLTYLKGGRRDV